MNAEKYAHISHIYSNKILDKNEKTSYHSNVIFHKIQNIRITVNGGKQNMDCLFCKIIAGEIPSSKVYEDDKILAFRDINPMAKVHVLVIPKLHISSADEITSENSEYVAHVFEKIPEIAKSLGLEKGYRVITNIGEHGTQSVKHLHFHILGGEQLPGRLV